MHTQSQRDHNISADDHLPLDLARLQQRLAGCTVGHTIDYHVAIPSTMPRAHQLAQEASVRAGAIVVAEEQTAGRGRRARTWHAPPRTGLLTSVILKPPLLALPPSHAPMLAAVAAHEAISALVPGLAASLALKWPNDLLIDGRKVAGLLAESSLRADGSLAYAILGIGINANQRQADLPPSMPGMLPPTSLRQEAGAAVDRTDLLALLCERLAAWLAEPNAALLHLAWKRRLGMLGQRVAVHTIAVDEPATWIGTAVDVDASGALIVANDAGELRAFEVGEVTLRPTE